MGGILILTMNPNIDTSCRVPHVAAEQKLRGSCPKHEPGGGGINVSRAIMKPGDTSLALFPSGKIFGKLLTAILGQEGVSCRRTDIAGETLEDIIVLEESNANRFPFRMPGPAMWEHERHSLLGLVDTLESAPEHIIGSGILPPGGSCRFLCPPGKKGIGAGSKRP